MTLSFFLNLQRSPSRPTHVFSSNVLESIKGDRAPSHVEATRGDRQGEIDGNGCISNLFSDLFLLIPCLRSSHFHLLYASSVSPSGPSTAGKLAHHSNLFIGSFSTFSLLFARKEELISSQRPLTPHSLLSAKADRFMRL